MPNQPGASYRVCFTGEHRRRVQELAERAARMGFGDECLAAIQMLIEQLERDPVGWGEPRYTLKVLGLLVCHKAHALLHVSYAVDEVRRLVYIRSIDPLPGHPFAQDG